MSTRLTKKSRSIAAVRQNLRRIHSDEGGSISILSVFAVLLLAMLFGLLLNVGKQADGKIRLQNAADAAAWSGGATISRGMNTLAFTNHLLADIFSVTAIMREGRDKNAASYVPQILAAWDKVAPVFKSSRFPKFVALGTAIPQKTPLEQEMVSRYTVWMSAVSERVLPLFEDILAQQMIPQYQSTVVIAFPDIAQAAAMEVAGLNGDPDFGRGRMLGAMWRTSAELVGGQNELTDPSLPVVNPNDGSSPEYALRARRERNSFANQYLNAWNAETMAAFDQEGKMSQFGGLWRAFTCGQLQKLLNDEFPNSNLPFQIRTPRNEIVDSQQLVERNFMFVGVAYWKKVPEILPGLFKNPIAGDAVAFAQVRVFVPRRRLEWQFAGSGGSGGGPSKIPIGGVPGEIANLPSPDPTGPFGGGGGGSGRWYVGRQRIPTQWDLTNQHWTCQLVPATGPNLSIILQTMPPLPAFAGQGLTLPSLGSMSDADIGRINTH